MLNTILKELRKRNGITQERLADILGVERSSIGKYESPNKPVMPSSDVLIKMSEYFNVTVDYLLGRTSPSSYRGNEVALKKGIIVPPVLEGADVLLADDSELTQEDLDVLAAFAKTLMEERKKKKKGPKGPN